MKFLQYNRITIIGQIMQLQSLFSKEEKSDNFNALELNISQLVQEINDYLEVIKNLAALGFSFSMQDNVFTHTQAAKEIGGLGFLISTTLLVAALPGSGIMKIALVAGLTGAAVYKLFSRENGIHKEKINFIKNKTETLHALMKNDSFKVGLIVNIEKDFNTLEEKFQLKPETLSLVKKKRSDMINEIKSILIEENLNNLPRLLILLTNIKQIEEQTQKLLKLDQLNSEVNKHLNSEVTENLEDNEVTEKIKSLL